MKNIHLRIGDKKMSEDNKITIPAEIANQLWTRYLPETTYKTLALIGYLEENNIAGEKATEILLHSNIEVENNVPQIIEEKKSILAKLGFDYPEKREDDIKLLLEFKLIEKSTNDNGEERYKYNENIKKPAEVLDIDEEEINVLENIKFEMIHEQGLNMILTLILNNNGKLTCPLEHIISTTRIKLTEVKEVLDYLANNEGSIKITADKKIDKLKKQDKVYITLNEEVFNKKRFVV